MAGLCGTIASAAEYTSTRSLFLAGKYEDAEKLAGEEVERGIWNERWPRLLIRCQLEQGKYAEALATYDAAIKRYPTSLTLRMLGLDVIRRNNLIDRSREEYAKILQLLQGSAARFASRDNLIAAGRYFETKGEDARQILRLFYDRVRDADPNFLEAYIATAELALTKGDFKVAAETLQAAERIDASDPRTAYLLARAFESSDSQRSKESLQRALKLNPNHSLSLLMLAENMIDAEAYDDADAMIDSMLKINPKSSQAIALQAVLAHLRGDYEAEKQFRDKALESWSRDPEVDHRIGRMLSQKYRFTEGAEYQRKALTFSPKHVGASFQLAQDLLRLGDEDIGWQLAQSVADEDEYNVVAHNLITLHDRIKQFSTIDANEIYVRMDPRESAIYGADVLELLSEAREQLCEKYDVVPGGPVVVEIFPEQKDFAIRTFGLPGGAGFLGVCFGRVITANSPVSQGERPANWKSVLWHEFCHVVTLEKTKNRMPRWLSEGISVYEECQRDASWGESMTPAYREMLLSEDLTPVSKLSGAFLSPPSPIHLQFAYYESSLVVEFLIEEHGLDKLKLVLVDLGGGLPINDALARHMGSLNRLDSQFDQYAKKIAADFGAKADWSRDAFPEKPTYEQLQAWVDANPDNFWGRQTLATMLLRRKDFAAAKTHLEHLVSLETTTGATGGVLEMLASVYRLLDEDENEKATLEKIVGLSSNALPALRRLVEISTKASDWQAVDRYGKNILSINPMLPLGQQAFSRAAEELEQPENAVRALEAMQQMEPIDPAGLNYRLANALHNLGQSDKAKKHVLAALEEAPRYRDAHRLLLKIVEDASTAAEAEPDAKPDAINDASEKPQDEKPQHIDAPQKSSEPPAPDDSQAARDQAARDQAARDQASRAEVQE
ncbi:tetratricopeptide repeat protein [Planctomycetes bacterium K23_9]|uniref:Tetratricopeptide repeat protein n=1 Tax=Stieleria marina TaxID=1930275 RepID=A0A517NYN7_9BACT|nr:tetratricopeptide repeat protein [Planctomycetes bacterium K23_9]